MWKFVVVTFVVVLACFVEFGNGQAGAAVAPVVMVKPMGSGGFYAGNPYIAEVAPITDPISGGTRWTFEHADHAQQSSHSVDSLSVSGRPLAEDRLLLPDSIAKAREDERRRLAELTLTTKKPHELLQRRLPAEADRLAQQQDARAVLERQRFDEEQRRRVEQIELQRTQLQQKQSEINKQRALEDKASEEDKRRRQDQERNRAEEDKRRQELERHRAEEDQRHRGQKGEELEKQRALEAERSKAEEDRRRQQLERRRAEEDQRLRDQKERVDEVEKQRILAVQQERLLTQQLERVKVDEEQRRQEQERLRAKEDQRLRDQKKRVDEVEKQRALEVERTKAEEDRRRQEQERLRAEEDQRLRDQKGRVDEVEKQRALEVEQTKAKEDRRRQEQERLQAEEDQRLRAQKEKSEELERERLRAEQLERAKASDEERRRQEQTQQEQRPPSRADIERVRSQEFLQAEMQRSKLERVEQGKLKRLQPDRDEQIKPIHEHLMADQARRKPEISRLTVDKNKRLESSQAKPGLEQDKRLEEERLRMFKAYVAVGVVHLPFDNVTESITVFYDSEKHRSRVDYGARGLVRTIQLGEQNRLYRVEFPYREGASTRPICTVMSGKSDHPVKAQLGVPDLALFQRAGTDDWSGTRVDRWKYELDDKKHATKHVFWLSTESKPNSIGRPLELEVVTIHARTGQAIDRYFITYKYFFSTTPSESIFHVPTDLDCRSTFGLPFEEASDEREVAKETAGRGLQRDEVELERLNMNPLGSLVDPHQRLRLEDELDKGFKAFKRFYSKKYANRDEDEKRRIAFFHNFRYINFMNRAGLSYRLRLNHLADLTNDELQRLLGFRRTSISDWAHKASFDPLRHNPRGIDSTRLPDTLDWRLFGAVTPVLDQRQCGSDWAAAVTSVVEGAVFLRSNRLVRLSAQELVDCSHKEGNRDCERGEDFRAYEYILKHGLSSVDSYGFLKDHKDQCRRESAEASVKIKQWVLVPSNNEFELKRAIAMNGPVALALDAAHKSFFFYSSGIYWEPNCRRSAKAANHAVVAVGYGELNGRDYFIVKNSWSEDWGSSGYMLIDASHNQCGILSWPTFVSL